MIIARSQSELETAVQSFKAHNQTIGFVPTMGALHKGHLSLVKQAQSTADKVAVSIFVNPTQFAPNEDFSTYPRQEDRDLLLLQEYGTDLVYLPSEKDLYPNGKETTVKAGIAAKGLESDFRPHFFDGVATVVHRLLSQVQPDVAVFGEKDFQQLMVIREMVEEEDLNVAIIGGETIRDAKGLALSSRNAYLSADEYMIASQLNEILDNCAQTIALSPELAESALINAKDQMTAAGFDKIDYVDIRWNRILAAAWLGKTRLIDNIPCSQVVMQA